MSCLADNAMLESVSLISCSALLLQAKASTLSLSVLVAIEMLNALNALSEDGSLLQVCMRPAGSYSAGSSDMYSWVTAFSKWPSISHTVFATTSIFSLLVPQQRSLAVQQPTCFVNIDGFAEILAETLLLLMQMPPWRNPWLLVACVVSISLHCVILYVPTLAGVSCRLW